MLNKIDGIEEELRKYANSRPNAKVRDFDSYSLPKLLKRLV